MKTILHQSMLAGLMGLLAAAWSPAQVVTHTQDETVQALPPVSQAVVDEAMARLIARQDERRAAAATQPAVAQPAPSAAAQSEIRRLQRQTASLEAENAALKMRLTRVARDQEDLRQLLDQTRQAVETAQTRISSDYGDTRVYDQVNWYGTPFLTVLPSNFAFPNPLGPSMTIPPPGNAMNPALTPRNTLNPRSTPRNTMSPGLPTSGGRGRR